MAAVVEATDQRWRPRKHLWAAVALLIVGGLGVNAIAEWRDTHGVLINSSESLPNWMFVIHKTHVPARGDYVGAPQGLSYGQRQSEQMVNKSLSVAAKYIKFRGFVRLDELEV
ncbi:hypothetical protein ABLE43_21090, partial [Sphingomonas sp. VNH70]